MSLRTSARGEDHLFERLPIVGGEHPSGEVVGEAGAEKGRELPLRAGIDPFPAKRPEAATAGIAARGHPVGVGDVFPKAGEAALDLLAIDPLLSESGAD